MSAFDPLQTLGLSVWALSRMLGVRLLIVAERACWLILSFARFVERSTRGFRPTGLLHCQMTCGRYRNPSEARLHGSIRTSANSANGTLCAASSKFHSPTKMASLVGVRGRKSSGPFSRATWKCTNAKDAKSLCTREHWRMRYQPIQNRSAPPSLFSSENRQSGLRYTRCRRPVCPSDGTTSGNRWLPISRNSGAAFYRRVTARFPPIADILPARSPAGPRQMRSVGGKCAVNVTTYRQADPVDRAPGIWLVECCFVRNSGRLSQ